MSDLVVGRRTALAALASPWVRPARAGGRVLRVGGDGDHRWLSDALAQAADGDTIELAAGVHEGQVGVVSHQRLTLRGLDTGAVLHAAGRSAEDKAILVVRGGQVDIDNLHFCGARVAAGNGAGIRFERGRLALRRCSFVDNEMGLLAANHRALTLRVEGCHFSAAPHHPGLLHHLLYVGAIGELLVRDSSFGGGHRGHLLKSRAATNRIERNRLDDRDGEASYELEFPDGGHNVVLDNLIVQGALTQNPTLVSIGAEARAPGGSLRMTGNTLVNLAGADARFVRIWHERLGDIPLSIEGNVFVGPGEGPAGAHNVHRPAPP